MIIFIAYVGAMGFMSVYGFIHGDVTKLLAPIDGNGQFCGIKNTGGKGDEYDFTDYPKLYIGDLDAGAAHAAAGDLAGVFDTGVCVKTCPKALGKKIGVECKPDSQLCRDISWSSAYDSDDVAGLCLPPSAASLPPAL